MVTQDKLNKLAQNISDQIRERYAKEYPKMIQEVVDRESNVRIIFGKKYIKIDVGSSGKYMVEASTGDIYGIKAYGQIHRGHYYGNLDTIEDWTWGNYVAGKIS